MGGVLFSVATLCEFSAYLAGQSKETNLMGTRDGNVPGLESAITRHFFSRELNEKEEAEIRDN
jgi:hypothetical protein